MDEEWSRECHLLRLFAESSDGLVLYVDPDRHVLFVNERSRTWLGAAPETLLRRELSAILRLDRFSIVHACIEQAAANMPAEFETELEFADGWRRTNGRAVADVDSSGTLNGVLVVLRDATSQSAAVIQAERAKEGLIDLKDQALQVAEEKSRFLAAASHDLRQPLHAMTLFARALSQRVDEGEASELVRQLQLSLHSLRRMFNSLLDLSKLDSGLVVANLVNSDLADLVAPLQAEFETVAHARGLNFRSVLADVAVRTDPGLLQTVLRNLLTNAIKFTKSGGILLSARRRDDHVLIQLFDTGPGIEPARQESIFKEFERSKLSAVGANDGIGLGLAIVARLSALLDCKLSIRSRPDRGTCFSLEVPRAVEARGSPGRRSVSKIVDRAAFQGRRLVVIDDDPRALVSVAGFLRDLGFDVSTAGSSADIPGLVSEVGVPDVCILDYDLGDDTGINAYQAYARAVDETFPAMIITGSTEPGVLRELEKSGLRWLTKPVDPDLLAAALSSLVERQG